MVRVRRIVVVSIELLFVVVEDEESHWLSRDHVREVPIFTGSVKLALQQIDSILTYWVPKCSRHL